MSKLWKKN